jgi:adenine/guanine phosphoribosyltransferase-like PRPP-binding protein
MVARDIGYREKIALIKTLKALNRFYSLRDLEQMLGVPFQSLWKYINFVGMPSDEVAEEILNKLAKLRIVEEILIGEAKKYRAMPQHITSNMGFLELYTIKLSQEISNKDVDLVIASSLLASPLAILLGQEINADLCLPLPNENIHSDSVKVLTFFSTYQKKIELLLYPKHCIREKRRTIITDIVVEDASRIESIVNMVRSKEGEVEAIATVYIGRNVLEVLSQLNLRHSYYIEVL